MQCPECRTELASSAKYCGCGWKRSSVNAPVLSERMPCEHEGCSLEANVKVRIGRNKSDPVRNLCHAHVRAEHNAMASAYCANLGLFGLEAKREWLSRKWPEMKVAKRMPEQREPGSDDE